MPAVLKHKLPKSQRLNTIEDYSLLVRFKDVICRQLCSLSDLGTLVVSILLHFNLQHLDPRLLQNGKSAVGHWWKDFSRGGLEFAHMARHNKKGAREQCVCPGSRWSLQSCSILCHRSSGIAGLCPTLQCLGSVPASASNSSFLTMQTLGDCII